MKPHIWFDGTAWCVRVNGRENTGIASIRLMQTLWPYILEWNEKPL